MKEFLNKLSEAIGNSYSNIANRFSTEAYTLLFVSLLLIVFIICLFVLSKTRFGRIRKAFINAIISLEKMESLNRQNFASIDEALSDMPLEYVQAWGRFKSSEDAVFAEVLPFGSFSKEKEDTSVRVYKYVAILIVTLGAVIFGGTLAVSALVRQISVLLFSALVLYGILLLVNAHNKKVFEESYTEFNKLLTQKSRQVIESEKEEEELNPSRQKRIERIIKESKIVEEYDPLNDILPKESKKKSSYNDVFKKIEDIKKNGATPRVMQQTASMLQKEREKEENKTPERQRQLNKALAELLEAMNKNK